MIVNINSSKLIYERISIVLLITANVLYSLACFSHSWFQLPDVSYGLWVAKYCDYLSCQIIPAFFTEEPVWYHILQALGLFGWSLMVASLVLLTSKKFDTSIPQSWIYHKQLTVSAVCIISVFVISLCLVMFYGKLDESYSTGNADPVFPASPPRYNHNAVFGQVDR